MDSLSPNTAFNTNVFAYVANDRPSSSDLKNSELNTGSNRLNTSQILFQKQGGTNRVTIVRKPSGKIKAYLEEAKKDRQSLMLKGAPHYLKAKHIDRARAFLNNSDVILSQYQVDVLPKLKGGMMAAGEDLEVVKPGLPYMQTKNASTAQRFLRLAQEFEDENDFTEAEESFKKALKYTDDPKDYKCYARFIEKLNIPEKAYKAYLELGKLHESKNQPIEAKTSYEVAKAFFPEKEEVLKMLVTVVRKLEDSNELVKALGSLACLYEKDHCSVNKAIESYEEIFELTKERLDDCITTNF